MDNPKIAEATQQSINLVNKLKEYCYSNLSLEKQLVLKQLELKIQEDLVNFPDNFFKNLITYTALKDAFFLCALDGVQISAETIAPFPDEFCPLAAASLIEAAYLSSAKPGVTGIIQDELAAMVLTLLSSFTNPNTCMHYYFLYLRNAEPGFRATVIEHRGGLN